MASIINATTAGLQETGDPTSQGVLALQANGVTVVTLSSTTGAVFTGNLYDDGIEVGVHAKAAFNLANNNSAIVQTAYTASNNAYTTANNAYVYAQSAFTAANVGSNFVSSGGTITGNVSFTKDITVTGNLTILGNTTTINTSSFQVQDSMIVLAVGNYTTDVLDIGFAGHYNAGTNAHSGIIRDAASKEYYIFDSYTPELSANNNIDTDHASFRTANVNANFYKGNLIATNATVTNLTLTNYTETLFTTNTGASITLDLNNGTVQKLTMTASSTITMPTAVAGKSFVIMLKQDGTGSRLATWSTVLWPSGTAPTLTTAANKTDMFSFFSDGTSWYGTTIGQNY